MSTLSHTQQTLRRPSLRQISVAALIALVTAAEVTIVLIASSGSSTTAVSIGGPQTGVQHGTPAQELQAVSGARYGLKTAPPSAAVTATANPTSSNGDATNASPRFRLPGQLGQGNRLVAKLR